MKRGEFVKIVVVASLVCSSGVAYAQTVTIDFDATVSSVSGARTGVAESEFNTETGLSFDDFEVTDSFNVRLFVDLSQSGVNNAIAAFANPSNGQSPLDPPFLETFLQAGGVSVSPNDFPGAVGDTGNPDADQSLSVSSSRFNVFNDYDNGFNFDIFFNSQGNFGFTSLADFGDVTQAQLDMLTSGNGTFVYSTSAGSAFTSFTIDDATLYSRNGVVVSAVPEVSATGALAAFGCLLALMAFLWERRRLQSA